MQRRRMIGKSYQPGELEFVTKKRNILSVQYIWPEPETEDLRNVMDAYEKTGAKFLVSMLHGVYFGAEGLWMTDEEIREARRRGMEVGMHYNFQQWHGLPSIGDPGFVEWYLDMLKRAVQDTRADFIFFDGKQMPAAYLKSAEFVAWYYNWADENGIDVWVNDDLGSDWGKEGLHGDVLDLETETMTGISARTFIYWDHLRNEWDCWVNEFGTHRQTGDRWAWEYKATEDVLRVFLDVVSKGGVWIVQMVNTKRSWEIMTEIGDWLAVNGEAVYSTRPFGPPQDGVKVTPHPVQFKVPRGAGEQDTSDPRRAQDWWWKWQQVVREAKRQGDLYFTRKGETVYVIHWGWPGKELLVPGLRARPGSAIRMLGVDADLEWRQSGEDLVIQAPGGQPCKYAYAFRIQEGESAAPDGIEGR